MKSIGVTLQRTYLARNFVHPRVGSESRVQLGIPRDITWDIPREKLLLGTCSHNASVISY